MTIRKAVLAGALLAALVIPALAAPGYPYTNAVNVPAATATTTGRVKVDPAPLIAKQPRSWAVTGSTTSGTGNATGTIEASMDGVTWISPPLCSFTLPLTSSAVAGGCRDESSYSYYSLNVSAISGAGASVSLTVGY